MHTRSALLHGLKTSIPVAMGYAPTGLAFGLVATQAGMEWYLAVMMAALVFAGAAQFASLQLLRAGAGPFEIWFTTFMINLRLIIVSASMASRLRQGTPEQRRHLKYLPPISFIMSDSAFLVASLQEHTRINAPYLVGLNATAYSTWVLSTVAGALIGPLIPPMLGASMAITIYALFAATLTAAAQKEPRLLIISGSAAVINTILNALQWPTGWALLAASLIAGSLSLFVLPRRKDPAGNATTTNLSESEETKASDEEGASADELREPVEAGDRHAG